MLIIMTIWVHLYASACDFIHWLGSQPALCAASDGPACQLSETVKATNSVPIRPAAPVINAKSVLDPGKYIAASTSKAARIATMDMTTGTNRNITAGTRFAVNPVLR